MRVPSSGQSTRTSLPGQPVILTMPLNRVIYARSFSKTLSGSLRVGFVACSQQVANELADIKMLTSITTSPFTERLVYRNRLCTNERLEPVQLCLSNAMLGLRPTTP